MYEWKDVIAWTVGCAVAALFLWGCGAIIAQEQKNGQERSLKCIEAGGVVNSTQQCVYSRVGVAN